MISTPADDAITLLYQPWLDGQGRAGGLEALMRWHHQERGANSPEAFIPISHTCGLIRPLSRWTLTQACTDASSWTRPLTLAFKLSPMQFAEPDLPESVGLLLGLSGLPAERLELAMTEATWLADSGQIRTSLAALARMGVRIALDEFGAGQSVPLHPPDYPFSKLKIDTSFIAGIDRSESARWIVSRLIEFGHSLDFIVSAEGVETLGQQAFLVDQGCDLMQGPLLGAPAPIETFAALIDGQPRAVALPDDHVPPPSFAGLRPFTEAMSMGGMS